MYGLQLQNKIRFEENLQRRPRFGLRGGNMVMSSKMQDGMNISFNKSLVTNELPSGDALKVRLGNWLLDNPVIPASGTFGYGYEFAELYDINCLGTFSFKGTTLEPRFGNPTHELQNVRRV